MRVKDFNNLEEAIGWLGKVSADKTDADQG
jgi:hypothetical protein